MHLKRTKLANGIIADFLPPKKSSNKVMILCDGMPSMPSKKKTMQWFSKKGFWVINPRYRGTWESSGAFLDHPPEQDVLDVIEGLSKGLISIWEDKIYKIKAKKIFVIGSSFGGTAALMSSMSDKVDGVVAISPVVDWTDNSESEPMDHLEKIIRDGYKEAYRFNTEDWIRLSEGKFFQPMDNVKKMNPKKIFVIYSKDDKVVSNVSIDKFIENLDCKSIMKKKGGHLSFSVITKWPLSKKMINFLV